MTPLATRETVYRHARRSPLHDPQPSSRPSRDAVHRRRCILQVLCLLLLVPWLSQAAPPQTYFVNGDSQNTNDCEKAKDPRGKNNPMKTINDGASCLKKEQGDTLIVQDGTYAERLNDVIPSGTAGSPTTVKAEHRGGAIIAPGRAGRGVMITAVALNGDFIVFDGFVVDLTNFTNVGIAANGSDIIVQYNEVKDMPPPEDSSNGGAGLDTGVACANITFAHNKVHDLATAQPGNNTHGVYVKCNHVTVEYNKIYDISSHGIQQFNQNTRPDQGSTGSNHGIFRGNWVHDTHSRGILVSSGTNNVAYNNVVTQSGLMDKRAAFEVGKFCTFACTNSQIYNNTVYLNKGPCILLTDTTKAIARNNICWSNGAAVVDNGSATTLCPASAPNCNVTSDPQFDPEEVRKTMENADRGDFHLHPGPAARGTGTDGCPEGCFVPTLFQTDFDDCPITVTARQIDAGAFQKAGCGPVVVMGTDPDITTGLVAYYKLNTRTDTTALDETANHNNGTLKNGPTWVPGTSGRGVQFAGATQSITIPASASLNNLPALTWSAWVNTTALVGSARFADKASANFKGWAVVLGGNGSLALQVDFATPLQKRSAPYAISRLNTWQHVAVTWDGGTTSTSIQFYMNGVQLASGDSQNGAGARVDDAANALLLANRHDNGRPYQGIFAEVRLYGRALRPADVAALYAFTTPPQSLSPSFLDIVPGR